MALDNAQFMSELSIVDPPGTDPLSEGDDQIRTSKRTQQQSFPNVDKAVTTTADQLNDVALQSGNNVFSATTNQFNDRTFRFKGLTADDDAGALFISDIDTLRWDIRRLATNLGGDLAINRYDSNGLFQSVPVQVSASSGRMLLAASLLGFDGTAAAPGFAFTTSSTTGMFQLSPAQLAFATGGVQRLQIDSVAVRTEVPFISEIGGSAGSPSFRITEAGGGMGMFSAASNVLSWSTQGTEHMNLTVSQFQVLNAFLATNVRVGMPGLVTGPGAPGAVSGDLYVKQSQQFAPTELVVGMQP